MSLLSVSNLGNEEDKQPLLAVENQVCELRPQDEGYASVQEQTTYSQGIYKTNFDNLNGQQLCDVE